MQSTDSHVGSPPKSEGRTIYYHIADENGNVEGEGMEGYSLNFKGNTVEELTRKLEEETGMQGIFVCSRSPLNGKLFPLRLQLPPNISTMHVVVVPSSSTGEIFVLNFSFPLAEYYLYTLDYIHCRTLLIRVYLSST